MNKTITEDNNKVIKSSQEQAVAAWINTLNQKRLEELVRKLNSQDVNLEKAINELAELKEFIGDPDNIIGNELTKHGEIAEHMQVNISNARRLIYGLEKEYSFEGITRTAPEDYLKNGQPVQAKFYNGLRQTFFGQHALEDHLNTYTDFVKNGGSYEIPKDQYEQLVDLLDRYKNNPSALNRSEYQLAKRIDGFIKENNLQLGKDINPTVIDYKDVQQGKAHDTVKKNERNIKKADKKQRDKAYAESMPSLEEGLKTTAISAAIEGGVGFCLAISKKRKEKAFFEFTEKDWIEIFGETSKNALKGGIRGGTVYALTNFTATPANVASAYVTAAFGVTSQLRSLARGDISEEDFVINCEVICLDVSISAISSLAGSILIPIPVLGAVIGNVAGEFAYSLCKRYGHEQAQRIISQYHKEMATLEKELSDKYLGYIIEIQASLKRFTDLERMAFDIDINIAFTGSVKLSTYVGVNPKRILKNKQEIDNYFIF